MAEARPTAIRPTGAACMIDRCRPNTSRGTARMPPPAPVSARIAPTTAPSAKPSRPESIDRFLQVVVVSGRASHSRPFSMPCQYSGGSSFSLRYHAARDGRVPSISQRGKDGATLPP